MLSPERPQRGSNLTAVFRCISAGGMEGIAEEYGKVQLLTKGEGDEQKPVADQP